VKVRSGATVGSLLLAALACGALAAPWLAPEDPRRYIPRSAADVFAAPGPGHWLGTDDAGGDVLSLLLWGGRLSLVVGLFAAIIAVGIGGTVGLVAGFFGGAVDRWLMRLTDVMLVLPALPLAIVLAAVTKPGLINLIVVIALVGWPATARLVRSQALTARQRQFVRRARAQGAGRLYVLITHVAPQVAPLLLVNGVLVVSQSILAESALSFLGLGDPDRPSWGQMLQMAAARGAMSSGAWWALLAPGLAIVSCVVGCALVGQALEARLRGVRRHWLEAVGTPRRGSSAAVPAPGSATSSTAPLLEVRGLTIDYVADDGPPVRAVEAVDLTVHRGEILGLVGESGCGKSTLLLGLPRLLPATARIVGGEVRLAGRDLAALGEEEMVAVRGREIGFVPQSAMNALNPVRSVRSQLVEALRQRSPGAPGAELRAAAGRLLGRVGVDPERGRDVAYRFSGGMRQRVLIALALAGEPSLLCADEPTTALDVRVQAQILELFAELRRDLGLSVILVTHDLGVVAELCDRVTVLYGGVVAESGPVGEVLARPRHPYTRELLRAFPDPSRAGSRLASIPGAPPSLSPPPAGCRFAGRCPLVTDRCRVETPELRPLDRDHAASCHFPLVREVA
jgi:oligopeptide/dipeptide ABC transporter ATP-binding protein